MKLSWNQKHLQLTTARRSYKNNLAQLQSVGKFANGHNLLLFQNILFRNSFSSAKFQMTPLKNEVTVMG